MCVHHVCLRILEPAVQFASLVPKMLSEGDRQMVGKIGYFLVHEIFGGGCLAGWRLVRHLCRRAGGFGECNRSLVRQDAYREFIRGGATR